MASVIQYRKCALHCLSRPCRSYGACHRRVGQIPGSSHRGQQPYMERAKDTAGRPLRRHPPLQNGASQLPGKLPRAALQQCGKGTLSCMQLCQGGRPTGGQRRCQSMRPLSVRAITSSFVLRACDNHVSLHSSSICTKVHPMCVFYPSLRDTPSTATAEEHYK